MGYNILIWPHDLLLICINFYPKERKLGVAVAHHRTTSTTTNQWSQRGDRGRGGEYKNSSPISKEAMLDTKVEAPVNQGQCGKDERPEEDIIIQKQKDLQLQPKWWRKEKWQYSRLIKTICWSCRSSIQIQVVSTLVRDQRLYLFWWVGRPLFYF